MPISLVKIRTMLSFHYIAIGISTFSRLVYAVTVTVNATASHPIPTTLCEWSSEVVCNKLTYCSGGQMFEVSPSMFLWFTGTKTSDVT
jgi:hypothetical protein